MKHAVSKTNCRAKALAKFFLSSKGKHNYTTDKVIATVLNGSVIEFLDSDNDIQEGFVASSSEEDEESIESVPVNKDTIPTKEVASMKRRIIWQKKEFDKFDSTRLHDHTANDQTSPVNLVGKYFTHQIYSLLAEQTNKSYLQKTGNEFNITPSEMKQFIGICILIGNLNFARLRMYWGTNYRIPCIANAMTQKRFLSIFANLKVTRDDEAPLGTTNDYWKVQPIIDAVLKTCEAFESEEHNGIDEQIIPFQGRVPCRAKPCKSFCSKWEIGYGLRF